VSAEKRVHLVEYITHLSLEDWEAVTEDLVMLDFLPADMTAEQLAIICPVIKDVMGQLVIGGTAGISIGSLSIQVRSQFLLLHRSTPCNTTQYLQTPTLSHVHLHWHLRSPEHEVGIFARQPVWQRCVHKLMLVPLQAMNAYYSISL
jgi:hypothetical protein